MAAAALQQICDEQSEVVSRQQALELGQGRGWVAHRVRRGEWRQLYPGVYVTHQGPVPFAARVWAALLSAGPQAAASHRTAAYLRGLLSEEPDTIDVSVPNGRSPAPQKGLRIHRCRDLALRRHPAASPAQTRLEDTVLDLASAAHRSDDIVGWITRACQRRLTTPARVEAAARSRSRLRHRALIFEVLADVREGVASPLERRYARDVERAHGLPKSVRNKVHTVRGRRRYSDVEYEEFGLRIELEGLAYHPEDALGRDYARDNAAVALGEAVLKFTWGPVVGDACGVALDVAQTLRGRGWRGWLRPCSRGCPADRAA